MSVVGRPPVVAQAQRVLDLTAPDASDHRVAGGKGAGLARLLAYDLPVPNAVVLPAPAMPSHDGGPVPHSVRALAAEALDRLGEGAVAVRSSSTAEDGDDASYAGQYETVLGVRGVDRVADAIWSCLASATSDRVTAYQQRNAPSSPIPPMAIVIQRMLQPDAAGVAFTANPVTGHHDEVLVAAVRGLGDHLASGAVNPDEWVVRHGDARCLTASQGAVDEATVRQVATVARRVEALAGAPQDVEWAVADGHVHLLQARPVTALPTPPIRVVPPGPWMKDTAHYTGPMSPLSASAYIPRLGVGIRHMLATYGFLMADVAQEVIGWEVYAHPVSPSNHGEVGERIATAIAAIDQDRPGQAVQRWRDSGRDALLGRADALRNRALRSLSDTGLRAHLDDCLDLLRDGQVAHFDLFVPYLLATHDLATTCQALLGWDLSQALELVSGLSEASSAPARDLHDLAEAVRAVPLAARAIRGWQPGRPLRAVLTDLGHADPALAEGLRDHVERYGCRVPASDVADPTIGERPELTLRLLRDLVDGAHGGTHPATELARRREQATDRARRLLNEAGVSGDDRHRFEQVLATARDCWGLREDNLVVTDAMPNGLLRLVALEIGRRLVTGGRLRRPADVIWLEEEQLQRALDGDGADLRPIVARRRAEHAWVRANPGPLVYGEPSPPPPPMDALPWQARRLMTALGWLMGAEFDPPIGEDAGGRLRGLPGSPGQVTATARIVRDEADFGRLGPGEVLVCRLTTPVWTVLYQRAAAVVTDFGSPLSHAAIVAREHAVPAVVGTTTATAAITDGQLLTVDGTEGVVTWFT
jgi:rifampicin phosphotransferase